MLHFVLVAHWGAGRPDCDNLGNLFVVTRILSFRMSLCGLRNSCGENLKVGLALVFFKDGECDFVHSLSSLFESLNSIVCYSNYQ